MKARPERGFTLVEALIATMILAVAATVIIEVFAIGTQQAAARAARLALYEHAHTRLSLLEAEVRASGADIDREVSDDRHHFRETARRVATGAQGQPTSLIEIAVTAGDANEMARGTVTLSGFVIARTPQ